MAFIKKIKKSLFNVNKLFSYDAQQNAKHDYENVFINSKNDLTKSIQLPPDRASMLVLGCGYNYPDVILFNKTFKYVAGIDIIGAFYRDSMAQIFRDLKNREGSTASALFIAMLIKYRFGRYYKYLEKISGVSIDHRKYELFSYDGHQIPFKDGTFDVVLSNAVLEHVEDLEKMVQEVHRITSEQGISYHLWHNYYSFSGGHAPESICLKHPWGHLRGKYETYALNKLTPSEIQSSYSKYFDILALYQMDKNHNKKGIDGDFRFEREELLSESIRNELNAYPKELLLTRAYLIIARKR